MSRPQPVSPPVTEARVLAAALLRDMHEVFLSKLETRRPARSESLQATQATRRYCDLIFAAALARADDRTTAEDLHAIAMERLERLSRQDEVHRYLTLAFGARYDQCVASHQISDPLPLEVRKTHARLERFLKYKVNRIRAACSTLRPDEAVDATHAFELDGRAPVSIETLFREDEADEPSGLVDRRLALLRRLGDATRQLPFEERRRRCLQLVSVVERARDESNVNTHVSLSLLAVVDTACSGCVPLYADEWA